MIKLENISKKYNNKTVVKDVSVAFDNLEVTSIIGPSGSGKTTLLRLINRLEIPEKGSIYISDKKLTKKNQRNLCQKIGMVFQNFNLFPHMTVLENLIYSPINVKNSSYDKAYNIAKDLLNSVGLIEKTNHYPNSLSGGQKQRIAICRALMMEPKVLMLDEPTSALDPESIKNIITIIENLKASLNVIIVTHHIKFAQKVSDRIIFMDSGIILADQSKNDFFAESSSHRAKLFLETIDLF